MVVQDGVGVSTCRLEREDDMGARVLKLEEELRAEKVRKRCTETEKVWYVPVGIVVGEGGEDKQLQVGHKGS